MRVLLQRVGRAQVTVDDRVVGQIGQGLLLLVGVTEEDTPETAASLATKIANLRIFEDEAGQMNRSALDLAGEPEREIGVLVVSQFTLYADVRKGRRPSFTHAAPPAVASPLVDQFAEDFRKVGLTVAEGKFGAAMAVELVNDGPVTIWLDSADLRR
jgi:D-tyrosyl-tRNA(Tyr) deacylase